MACYHNKKCIECNSSSKVKKGSGFGGFKEKFRKKDGRGFMRSPKKSQTGDVDVLYA
jgi:hypothetical protein